jgi:tetratricopeptide (TPR) repeat protein
MLSRVYTPPYRSYSRNNAGGTARRADQDTQDSDNPLPTPAAQQPPQTLQAKTTFTTSPLATPQADPQWHATQGTSGNPLNPASNLQSLKYSSDEKVPLNAVLTDFHSTMQAIGIDEHTQSEVTIYLHAANLQSTKSNPDVNYIKGSIKTAANTLDSYIGTALGKPSTVVNDWASALLQQNIDFKNQKPFQMPQTKPAGNAASGESSTALGSDAVTAPFKILNPEQKNQLRSTITAAKTAQSQGDLDSAQSLLTQAHSQLVDSPYPAIQGKVYRLQGQVYKQQGQFDNAIESYQSAADSFSKAQLPQKQADSLHEKASLQEDRGQLQNALVTYQQVHALDSQQTDQSIQSRSLHDLGRVSLQLGDTQSAIAHLQTAAEQSGTLPADVRSEMYTTLGQAYRRSGQTRDAITAFNTAARSARESGDTRLYAGSLQQYASVLLEGGQSDRAVKALEAFQKLNA